jgi:deoxyuridine 5'-triphosphate nucleotidohydrolase
MTTLAFQRLHDAAKLPTRGHPADAGLDLYSIETWTVMPGQRLRIDTGLAVAIPDDCFGFIADRSGLAWKHGITFLGRILDPGYSGPVLPILLNTSGEPFRVASGDRFCQLLVIPIRRLQPTWVEALPASERGAGGFGSSGAGEAS